jgi:hypothetical protein
MRSRTGKVTPSDSHGRSRGDCRLLKNGVPAHEFTREDRAKGGRARAEKIRRRKELRECFEVATLEGLATAEDELLERALVRHALLLSSDDPRVAWRACKELYDRLLGPAGSQCGDDLIGASRDWDAEVTAAREKLNTLIERRARAIVEERLNEREVLEWRLNTFRESE